jgi:hypothetical protein
LDRSIKKNGLPALEVGQIWTDNDERSGGRQVMIVDVGATPDDKVVVEVVSPRASKSVVFDHVKNVRGQKRRIRRSAFLGGRRGLRPVELTA